MAKDKRNQTANAVNCSSPCSREQSGCDSSSSDLADRKCLKKQKPTQGRKENELIDLFEEINAEQLLIEPEEMYVPDTQVVSSTPVSFNHKEWLAKLTEEVKDEKVPEWGKGRREVELGFFPSPYAITKCDK